MRLDTGADEAPMKAPKLHSDEINILFVFLSLFLPHSFQGKQNRISRREKEICLCQLHVYNPQSLCPAKIHSFALQGTKVRIETEMNTEEM